MDTFNNFTLFINKLFKYRFIGFIVLVFSIFFFKPVDTYAVSFGNIGVSFADSSGNVLYKVDGNDYNIELNVQNVKYILMYTDSYTIKSNGYNLFYDFAIGYQGMQYPIAFNVSYLLENRTEINFTSSIFNPETQIMGANGFYSRYHLNVDFIANSSNAWYQLTLTLPTEMNFTFYSVYNKKFTQTSGNSGSQIESSAQDIIDNQDKNTDKIIENQDENTDKITDSIDDLQNSILDDEPVSDDFLDGFFDGITSNFATDTPISDLVLMPFTLLDSYSDGISSTCSNFSLGNLYGTEIIMPCVDLKSIFGENLWNLIDMLFSLFLFYEIAMLIISIFDSITSLDDSFQLLYSPRHGNMSREGRGHSRGLY